ncbi:MAG: T9SS type A sorting domain-containing protein [Flavobacteriales bacterium]|nr:T9SS type A sorting domain-containing protein [Flavobacteriales bacterium]
MKTIVRTLSAFALLAAAPVQAQPFTKADVAYWVGTGTDSSVLVMDFLDGTEDHAYAWGFLHDGTATAQDMVSAIAAADTNLTADIPGGFLNSVTYNSHAGIGGSPDYWSTWSGTGMDDMAMNMGLAEVLSNGSWFGCSYTDFDPALPPTTPIAAFDPFRFTAADVAFWTGTGAHAAVLVVDFHAENGSSSFAWGVRFDGTTTGEALLNAVAAADPAFDAMVAGGFLNDILYGDLAGVGGAPNYWGTWGATNLGNWAMNLGIGTEVADGALFGCSYTDFAPALRPSYPEPASFTTAMAEQAAPALVVYPQPARDQLHIQGSMGNGERLLITDLAGKLVQEGRSTAPLSTVDVDDLAPGLYVLQAGAVKRTIAVQ